MIKLLDILKKILVSEARLTGHYIERKAQRGKILDIILPFSAYERHDKDETVNKLLPLIQSELYKRLEVLENSDISISDTYNVGYVVFSPFIKNRDQVYPIMMKISSTVGKSSVEKIYIGKTYVVSVKGNSLITLLLLDDDKNSAIIEKMREHDKQNKSLNNKEYTVVRNNLNKFIIDIDTLFGKEVEKIEKPQEEKIDISTLPYTVKTSYRPGSSFEHKNYGSGKIVSAASSGTRSGDPDARGMIDWIEVDFGKPYLSGGKFYKTRKLNNIYSTLYFKNP